MLIKESLEEILNKKEDFLDYERRLLLKNL